MTAANAGFQPGVVYEARSAAASDTVWKFAVVARTAKTVVLEGDGKVSRAKVHVWDGDEVAYPLGRYSMAPVLRASRPVT